MVLKLYVSCFLYFSIAIIEGRHYEEDTFFKYKIFFVENIYANFQSEQQMLPMMLDGISFNCYFNDENNLYSNYYPILNIEDVSSILKDIPMTFVIEEGWLYELYAKRMIFQSHIMNPKESYSLGVYSHAYFRTKTIENSGGKEQKYFTQVYVNGTICKTTGLLRSSEVVFVCCHSQIEEITNIIEISSCNYVIYVCTYRVCSAYGHYVFEHPIFCITNADIGLYKLLNKGKSLENVIYSSSYSRKGLDKNEEIEEGSSVNKRRHWAKEGVDKNEEIEEGSSVNKRRHWAKEGVDKNEEIEEDSSVNQTIPSDAEEKENLSTVSSSDKPEESTVIENESLNGFMQILEKYFAFHQKRKVANKIRNTMSVKQNDKKDKKRNHS